MQRGRLNAGRGTTLLYNVIEIDWASRSHHHVAKFLLIDCCRRQLLPSYNLRQHTIDTLLGSRGLLTYVLGLLLRYWDQHRIEDSRGENRA